MRKGIKLIFLLSAFYSMACGVKGDPIPPATPAELGRGRPQSQKVKPLLIPVVSPSPYEVESSDEED